ncbi:hypothetical protein ZIOFF_074180 [Zingiber officinale]|uniref:Retrovirus-related Pol polyprotein from transposon TNT 1-94-like beta-barrel domain-containing protein n=1 Tax=Zingiber officinale TaxID=94328 RepID=A0A8J5BZQ4_ZINOF|nr:hypothetical protein ZIOFF_074180 [Zingiber officinale]
MTNGRKTHEQRESGCRERREHGANEIEGGEVPAKPVARVWVPAVYARGGGASLAGSCDSRRRKRRDCGKQLRREEEEWNGLLEVEREGAAGDRHPRWSLLRIREDSYLKVALQKLASAEGYVVLCLASDIDAGLIVVSILQKEMEASGSDFSSTTPLVFDGENYQVWAVKMSTFMEGSDLWEAVKDDYEVTPLPDNPTINQIRFHKESITRKAKAKSCLYAAVSPFIFNRIMKFPTAKDIWNFLKIEYEGDEKIRGMKALNLMREFERQQMKENENTKDLSDIRLAKLLSALEAQEQRRLMRREVPVEAMEGALPARSKMRASGREKKSWNQQKGNAEGSSSNKGHAEQRHPSESGSAYQRERFDSCKHCGGTSHPHYKCWRRPDVKCNNCHKFGHIARFCQEKDSRQDATEGAVNNEVELMFTTSCFATGVTHRSWLVDSGCTHHMSYDEKSFVNLDRSFYAKVKIGNGDYIDVEGRGDVVVDGLKGRKLISDVLYVPKIDQNLLSVGQLVQKGYKVMLEEGLCLIADSSGKDTQDSDEKQELLL